MPPLRFALIIAFVLAAAAATVGLGWLLGQMLGVPVLGVGLAVPPLLILLVPRAEAAFS